MSSSLSSPNHVGVLTRAACQAPCGTLLWPALGAGPGGSLGEMPVVGADQDQAVMVTSSTYRRGRLSEARTQPHHTAVCRKVHVRTQMWRGQIQHQHQTGFHFTTLPLTLFELVGSEFTRIAFSYRFFHLHESGLTPHLPVSLIPPHGGHSRRGGQ